VARRLWDAGKQENSALMEQLLARCAP